MDDQKLKTIFTEYIDAHTDEMAADIMELCRIPSVKGEAREGAPFGAEPKAALLKARELMERSGLTTRIYDDRVVSGDLNDLPRALDILAHMDVVAAGEGWTVTKPFEPVIKDGRIYGRGTSDDKGPAVAALYAMRAVKELGIPISGGCRLVLGSDEESGSADLPAYLKAEGEAPMTFSPDSHFPVTNVEKGHFRATVSCVYANADAGEIYTGTSGCGRGRLISMYSGDTINIVPGEASAKVGGIVPEEITAAAESLKEETGADFICGVTSDGDITDIKVKGQAAHASLPDAGVNAGAIMIGLLSRLDIGGASGKAISALSGLFPYGDHGGDGIGAAGRDDIAGSTTVSPDIWRADKSGISVRIDARTSIGFDGEKVRKKVEGTGLSLDDATFTPAHVVPSDSPFVKTLLSAYEMVSNKPGYTEAIGGGTYVHGFKRGVAFGAVAPDTDTRMHGADEFMPIEELKQAAVIFAVAISKLLS